MITSEVMSSNTVEGVVGVPTVTLCVPTLANSSSSKVRLIEGTTGAKFTPSFPSRYSNPSFSPLAVAGVETVASAKSSRMYFCAICLSLITGSSVSGIIVPYLSTNKGVPSAEVACPNPGVISSPSNTICVCHLLNGSVEDATSTLR